MEKLQKLLAFISLLCFVTTNASALEFDDKTINLTVTLGESFVLNPASDLGMYDSQITSSCYKVTCDSYNETVFDVSEEELKTSYVWRTGSISGEHQGHYSLFHITSKKKGDYKITTSVTYMYKHYGTGASNKTSIVTYNIKIVAVESIVLAPNPLVLTEGNNYPLSFSVSPQGVNTTLTWSSSNNKVVTVNYSGIVVAQKAGNAVITCTAANGVKGTCNVIVNPATILTSKISLNIEQKELIEAQTFQLSETIAPDNATNKNVRWSSSNTSVATVSNSGLVTAVAPGSVIITCEAQDGSGVKATCTVTVKAAKIMVTGITLNASTKELTAGQTFQLSAAVLPSNATNMSVTWSSSNSSIASVNSDGIVTAVTPGSAVITCEAQDGSGVKATCGVTVVPTQLVSNINLSKDLIYISPFWGTGTNRSLSVTLYPDNATNKVVSWSSTDESVATVDQEGNVVVKKIGWAYIIAKTTDGSNLSDKCLVVAEYTLFENPRVIVPIDTIKLTHSSIEIEQGEVFNLGATLEPSRFTENNVEWRSSDPAIATVEKKWKGADITGVKPGLVNILVTSTDGNNITESCVVKVIEKKNSHGDVNGDNLLNGTDLVALVNIILAQQQTAIADVNGDGLVNGTDYVALVNLILNGGKAKVRAQASSRVSREVYAEMGIEPLGLRNSKNGTMIVSLENTDMDVTMVQFDLTLPQGLKLQAQDNEYVVSLTERALWKDHMVYVGEEKNGTVRLMIASAKNAVIKGTEGGILRLSLVADESFDGGGIVLENILCTSPSLQECRPQSCCLYLNKEDVTAIREVETDASGGRAYDLVGRRLGNGPLSNGFYILNGKKRIVK